MNAQTNVNNSGQKIRTVDITVTAAMAALVFLGTYIFKIPTISWTVGRLCIQGSKYRNDPVSDDGR